MNLPVVCIKIGGRVATDEKTLAVFIQELKGLRDDHNFVLVHGGGAEISRISAVFNIVPVFSNGVRVTRSEEMDIVDMVLAGKVNKQLVRQLYAGGVKAVGLSGVDGPTVIGEAIAPDTQTGRPKRAAPELLSNLLNGRLVPVVAPVSMDENGAPLNINADDVTLAIAAALPAAWLVFISDIPGILKNEKVIAGISPAETEKEITAGVITGGMIPKVRASAGALEDGVKYVVIGGYERKGDLQSLLDGRSGTTIRRNSND